MSDIKEHKEEIYLPYNFTPRAEQLDLFEAMDGIEGDPQTRYKRALLLWHRRCGKDMACLAYMFKEMFTRRGIYYYIFPSYAQGKKVLWEGKDKATGFRWMNMLPGFSKPGAWDSVVKRVNNQEMIVETVNGSLFRIIGSDNIDSIVGTNPIGCVFSEYALQSPDAWEYMSPILAENNGWAIFNGTPRGKNHFYRMYHRVASHPDWYCDIRQTLYPEEPQTYTGMVSLSQIDLERASGMDEDKIHQEYGCAFSAAAKGSYYNDLLVKARDEGRIGYFPPEDWKWTETAWDVGVRDSTAIWFFQRHGSSIRLIDYYEDSNKSLHYYVEVLDRKGYKYKAHHLPHDAGSRSAQTAKSTRDVLEDCLKEAGLGGECHIVDKNPIQAGINKVKHIFSRFYFHEVATEKGRELLSLYHKKYDQKRQVFSDRPVHDGSSHCADALRVLAESDELEPDEEDEDITLTLPDSVYDY